MAWICEDHPQISANGSTLTVIDGDYFKQCAPLNAYFVPKNGGAEKPGNYYWEFVFKDLTDGGWVGLTTEKHFGPGYSLKGFMYGGNLADGSCLLVGSFGERIQGDDKVGLLLQLTQEELLMYLFHNEKPLGLAFQVKKPIETPLFPCIHLYGPGKVTVTEPDVHPTQLVRNRVVSTTIEGEWKLKECQVNGQVNEESKEWRCKLAIARKGSRRFGSSSPEDAGNVYNAYINVVNHISCTLVKSEDKWTMHGGCTTLIGIYDKDRDAENFVHSFTGKVNDVKLENDVLTLVGSDGTKMIFTRAEEVVPGPCTKNVFESS